MRSLQTKIVLVFVLLILLAMQFIGVYLLRSLQQYYVDDERSKRIAEAQLLADDVAEFIRPAHDLDPQQAHEQLQELIIQFQQGRFVQLLVLSDDGAVLAASDPARIGQQALQEADALQALLTAQVRTYQREDPDSGLRLLGAAAPVFDEQGRSIGVTVVESDLGVIQQTLIAVRGILFSATLVAALAAVLLALVMARTITGPIRLITARAAEMASGDFEQRIEVRSQDELGRLAAMFNVLAGRLKLTLDEMADEKRKVEAILTHMADGVVGFDRDGRVLLINPAARRMLASEHLPAEDLIGREAGQLWPELPIHEHLQRVLQGRGRAHDEPVLIKRNDRVFRTYFAGIAGGDAPETGGAVWVLHDVTEMEKLEAMRQEFVANVSHELRTPLTTIKSYVETLMANPDLEPETRQEFMRVVNHESERMARLVKDLLDLSQLEAQEASNWEREYCLLSELAGQVLEKLHAQIEQGELTVAVDTPGGEEPLVYVDPDRMQQVLLNIVGNAVEFTPPGGSITVRIKPQAMHVQVEVIDTGIGIPAEDIPHLFERFHRVDKARTRKLGGTGLGLSIARKIVEGHGGRIGIRSRLGEGTCVWFTVPYEPLNLGDVDDALV